MESILANKLKSVLTALGIIFGVASVITMLAIGNGAQQEILEQIKMVGVNNIMITPIVQETGDSDEENGNGQRERGRFSRGLTLLDAEAIKTTIPSVTRMSPEIALNSHAVYGGKREQAKLIGVSSDYFELFNLPLESGTVFNEHQEENGLAVAVIGANIKTRFFPDVNPIGKYIKFGHVWLQVIGVIERTNVSVSAFENVGINVYNDNIYIPTKTMLMRYNNRGIVRRDAARSGVNIMGGGRGFMQIRSMVSTNPSQNTSSNYHQLDKIVVQVEETEQLSPTAELIGRMLLRRHSEVKDFEVTVPELLLKQQQRTREIFNIVLGAIASISLIVGGIGIMNIMFASVMERIKEIGTRQAIGATRIDIIVQFLSEAVLISVSGGLIGVILGIILSNLITRFADILTIVSFSSVLIAFFVSASVGVIFGYSPAKRAAEKDPIESLRYE
ncbi:MAG: FtsX-like permease family protein [Marinilabiliales bacterium]|nr:MAG: FtsX-like permease family protein [Marinilabiliales bacterium]